MVSFAFFAISVAPGLAAAVPIEPAGLGPGVVLHVDVTASGADDGSTWQDAFNRLQDALAAAKSGDEVRVAGGIYRPAAPGGDIALSFELKEGVALRGGFAGLAGDDPDARDVILHPTILSGDLSGDDVELDMSIDFEWSDPNRDGNSLHVVTCTDVAADTGTVLDGFTVTGGNADDHSGAGNYGGGMKNASAAPLVVDCIFRANTAESGGAMWNQDSRPVLRNCRFAGNRAYSVGVMVNFGGAPVIEDCVFEDNVGLDRMGVMENSGDLTVTRCIFRRNISDEFAGVALNDSAGAISFAGCSFIENSSDDGGVFWNLGGRIALDGCRFIGNLGYGCGCIENGLGSPDDRSKIFLTLRNCLFARNAAHGAAGIEDLGSTTVLANCTFADNEAVERGAAISVMENGSMKAENCIFWNNASQSVEGEDAQVWSSIYRLGNLEVDHCCVQGWTGDLGGSGNIDDDPLFRDEAAGDYRLRSDSPCVDAGTSVGAPATDIDGAPRPCGEAFDMGVYEYCGEVPPAQEFRRGDANADGAWDLSDPVAVFAFLFLDQMKVPCEQAGDANDDGSLDISDAVFLLRYLFLGGPTMEPPVDACGIDPTHGLSCGSFPGCG
jgi:hypothetical protein